MPLVVRQFFCPQATVWGEVACSRQLIYEHKSPQMKIRNLYYYALLLALVLNACAKKDNDPTPITNTTASANATKVLPLGASRVEGARPDYESYRYELWKLFVDNNKDVDFIGILKDAASYPAYKNLSFDTDHEGRGGATSGQILEALNESISKLGSSPDIVLLSSPGGNDALQNLSFDQAVQNVNAIVDLLQKNNPQVTIIIEQSAPPLSTANPAITTYLGQMNTEVNKIATAKTTSSSKIMIVDMATGFGDAMLADDVHYNEAGAQFIASRYYSVLKDLVRTK